MGVYKINGGIPLCGEVIIGGGKNAILPILAAAVLTNGLSVIHNCPKISDVMMEVKILEDIGCTVKWEGSTIIVDSSGANKHIVPDDLAMQMRSSIIFLGALIGRFKKAEISHPGG